MPSLLPKSIRSIPSSWDPQPNYDYLSVLSYVIYLLNNTEVDHLTKTNAKKLPSMTGHERHAFFEKLMTDIMPTGLVKKLFTKIVRSEYSLIQHTGLLLLKAILERIRSITRIIPAMNKSNVCNMDSVLKDLPDFSTLLTLRSRYFSKLCSFI